jgi:SUN domain-containing protein 1/2
MSKRTLTSATTFYMRPRSTEPADMSAANTTVNGKDSIYDYASEEQEYQDIMQQKQAATQRGQQEHPTSRRPTATHKRNCMSMDNKAYRTQM